MPERTLYRHARELQDLLETIPSVLEVRLSGQREELLEVIIDEQKLQAYNVSQEELLNAVTRNNRLVAAGEIDAGEGRFNIKVPGLFENSLDVYSLPVKVSQTAQSCKLGRGRRYPAAPSRTRAGSRASMASLQSPWKSSSVLVPTSLRPTRRSAIWSTSGR